MEIRERSLGSVVCLDLQGRLVTTFEDDRLTDKVNSLLFEGRRNILLNLEEVSGIDTSGLSGLITIRRAARQSGGQIKLLNLPSRIFDLLVVTKLITLFDIVESEADAIRAFSVESPREVTQN
jgi:anti-sigma B factor antagonist